MSPKLPAVTGKDATRIAQRLGSSSGVKQEATPFMFVRATTGVWLYQCTRAETSSRRLCGPSLRI